MHVQKTDDTNAEFTCTYNGTGLYTLSSP